jgi:hypothetical protein
LATDLQNDLKTCRMSTIEAINFVGSTHAHPSKICQNRTPW